MFGPRDDSDDSDEPVTLTALQQARREKVRLAAVPVVPSNQDPELKLPLSGISRSKLSSLIKREKLVRSQGAGSGAPVVEERDKERERQQLTHSRFYRSATAPRSLSPTTRPSRGSSSSSSHHMTTSDPRSSPSPAFDTAHTQAYDHDLLRRLDAGAFHDISQRVSSLCAKLPACPDEASLKKVFASAQTDFATFGLSQLQLWFLKDKNGTLESMAGETTVTLSQAHTAALQELATQQHGAKALFRSKLGTVNTRNRSDAAETSAGTGIAGSVTTVRPEDPIWDDLEKAMRLVGEESAETPLAAVALQSRRWYALHVISPRQGVEHMPRGDMPFFLVAESLSSPSSIAVTPRMVNSSPAQVKSIFTLECMQRLYSAMILRLTQFHAAAQALQQKVALAMRTAEVDVETIKKEYIRAIDASQSYGEVAELLSRAGHGLMDAFARSDGRSSAGMYAWSLLPLSAAIGAHLQPRPFGGHEVTYRAYSGNKQGESVHTRTMSVAESRAGFIGNLLGHHAYAAQVLPSVTAGELAQVGMIVARGDGDLETPDAENQPDDDNDNATMHFAVQAVSVPLYSLHVHGTHSAGTAVALTEDQRSEQCVVLIAGPAAHLDLCGAALRALGELAKCGFESMARRSQQLLTDRLRSLPGTLLMSQRFESTQVLPDKPSATRLVGAAQLLAQTLEEGVLAASALGAHDARLLFSDSYASSLQLLGAPKEDTLSFSHVGATGMLQSVQPKGLPFVRGTLLWLQQLLDGKPVRFVKQNKDALEGPVAADEAETETLVVRRSRDSQAALQQLVLGCMPSAHTAFLLPLHAAAGLCVLLVVDTLAPVEASLPKTASTYLGATDLLMAYESSSICSGLATALNVTHSMHLGQLAAFERGRAEKREAGQQQVLVTWRARQQRKNAFLQWRAQVLSREVNVSQRLLSVATAMMTPATETNDNATEDGSILGSFMTRVERHIMEVCPQDAVDVTFGGLALPANVADVSSGEFVLETEVETAGYIRSVLHGVVRDRSVFIASVRVVRTSAGARGPFPSSVVRQVEQICKFASLVYASFRRGLESPRAKGNVQGLLLPLLQKLLPLLAAQPALPQSQASLRSLLEELSTAFKYLCGGDVAILRMPYGSLSGSATAYAESAKGVCNVSSEDSEERSLSSLLRSFPSLTGYIRDESVAFEGDDAYGEKTFAQLVCKLTDGAGPTATALAEIKVLGPQDGTGFTADQATAAQLLSFAVSHIMSVAGRYRDLESNASKAHSIALELKSLLTKTSAELAAEQGSSATLRKRLSSALGLAMFTAQSRDLSTVQELAEFISEGCPPILGCSSAVLLLHTSHTARAAGQAVSTSMKEEEGLRVVLPAGAGSASDAPRYLSFTQLAEVPTYEAAGASGKGQEKILLQLEGSAVPFAAVLVLRASGSGASKEASRPWSGMADVLGSALVACVSASVDRMANAASMASMNFSLEQDQELLKQSRLERDRLQISLAQEMALKVEYAAKSASLDDTKALVERMSKEKQQQVQAHADNIHSIVTAHDTQAELHVSQVRTIEQASRALQKELEQQSTHAKQLSILCDSFAFDPRCHKQSVQQWLEEFIDTQGCMILQVSQAEDGSLSGSREVHGIIGAAAESLRTQSSVQISTTYSPQAPTSAAIGSVDASQQEAKDSATLLFRQRWLAIRKNGDRASVLCIPNKCISLHAAHDNAVYIFLRGAKDQNDRFTEMEETLLRCATGLCCRALFRASSRYSFEDIRRMELDLQQEKAILAKLRHAALVAESMLRRPCASTGEFAHEVETSVTSLLTRGASDPCSIDCMYWYIPTAFSAATVELPEIYDALHSTRHTRSDANAVKTVLSTERSVRVAGTMWVPLKNADGKLLALLRCERKLASHVATPSLTNARTTDTQMSDLVFTAEEEEAVCLFCGQGVATYYRVQALADAKDSIKQARRAMGLLEEGKTAADGQLAHTSRVKEEYKSTLTAGADLLAASCAKRVSADQIIEAARRALVALTGSLDCYIILPGMDGVFPNGPVDNATDAKDKLVNLTANDVLYCLESDRARPLRVLLDDGDLEKAALRAFRPLSVGAPHDGQNPDDRFSGGHASASWAVRRLYGRDTDNAADAASLHATAIPFVLIGGQRAVATVIRRGPLGAYTAADKECIAWLTRMLGYCLDMWVGKGSLQSARSNVEALTAELAHLRVVEKGASRLETDTHLLQQALCQAEKDMGSNLVLEEPANVAPLDAGAVPQTPEEAVETLVRTLGTVFVGANISILSASEAGQKIGDMLPPAAEEDVFAQKMQGQDEGKGEEEEETFSSALKQASAARGAVRSLSAKISYWIGRSSGANGEASPSRVRIVALVAHSAYPTTWLLVSGLEASGIAHQLSTAHVGLRLAVLLRLLEVQAMWRGRLFSCQENANRLKELARGLMRENSSQRDSHRSELHSREHSSIALTTVLLGCRKLTTAAIIRGGIGAAMSPGPWMKEDMDVLRIVVASATGWDVTLGHLRAMNAGSPSAGLALSMTNGSGWTFTAEEVAAMGLAPPAGQDAVLVVGPPLGAEAPVLPFDIENSVKEARTLLRRTIEAQLARVTLPASSEAQDGGSDEEGGEKENERKKAALAATDKPRLRLVPEFSSLFPAGTLLVPIVEAGLLIMLRLHRDAASRSGLAVDAVGALAAAHLLKDGVRHALANYKEQTQLRTLKEKRETQLDRTTELYDSLIIEHDSLSTQCQSLQSKLHRLADDSDRLRVVRIQNRRYERGLADWAEMIRGVNQAGTQLPRGIIGFWGQACKVLMSIISSHVTLRGCGLCVPYDSYAPHANRNDGIDVRDERGVDFFAQGYDGTEPSVNDDEDAFGASLIAARGLSELGGAVESHVLDLLDGKHNDGSRAVYRLSRPGERSAEVGCEEQVWLVPVRTPRAVLAVVRLSVLVRVADFGSTANAAAALEAEAEAVTHEQTKISQVAALKQAQTPSSPMPETPGRTKIRFTPDTRMTPTRADTVTPRTAGSVASAHSMDTIRSELTEGTSTSGLTAVMNSIEESIDAAQTDALNFAEVLAPLMGAANAMGEAQRMSAKMQEQTSKMKIARDGLHSHLVSVNESNHLQRRLLAELSTFGASVKVDKSTEAVALSAAAATAMRDAPAEPILSHRVLPLRALVERVGLVIGASVSLVLFESSENSAVGLYESDSAFGASTNNSGSLFTEPIPGLSGTTMGKINVALGKDGSRVLALASDRTAPGAELPVEEQSLMHSSVIRTILPTLVRAVSGFIHIFARERLQLRQIHSIESDIGRMQREIQQHVLAFEDEKLREAAATGLSRHYGALASLTRQCISYIGSLNTDTQGSAVENEDDGEDSGVAQKPSLSETLPLLCARMPGMLGVACEVSVGTYMERVPTGSAETARIHSGSGHLQWFHASKVDPVSEPLSQLLTQKDRAIADNLARACIGRRAPSTVDVSGTVGNSSIRLLSYPLMVPSHDGAMGVLQLALRESTATSAIDMARVDEFCDLAAASLACMVFSDRRASQLNSRIAMIEEDISDSQAKCEELEGFMNMWQRRADAWCAVATTSAVITRHSGNGLVSLADVLASEAVTGPLHGTGVTIRVRREPRSGSELVAELDEEKSRGRVRGDLVRLGEAETDPVVEIICGGNTGGNAKSSQGDLATFLDTEASVAPIASDIVDALSTVIRSTALAARSHSMEVGQLNRGNSALQTRITGLEANMSNMSDLAAHCKAEVRNAYTQLEATTSSMTSFCGPTIREISVMLEDLSKDRRPNAPPGEIAAGNQMGWAWEGLARVAERAMGRISDNTFGYHASLLVRTYDVPKHEEGGVQLMSDIYVRMYDMSRRKEVITIAAQHRSTKAAKLGIVSDPHASTIEKAILVGGAHENKNCMNHIDLVGIDKQNLTAIMDTGSKDSRVTVLCVALPDAPPGVSAVLRLVYPSDQERPVQTKAETPAEHAHEQGHEFTIPGPRSLIRPVFEMVMSLGCSVLHLCEHLSKQDLSLIEAEKATKKTNKERDLCQRQLEDTLRMHQIVSREACSLLDPPLVGPGGSAPRAVHPASLTPLAASQDACMKLLAMCRTLMQSEGQALLLRDNTTDQMTFQVIYSGNGLAYPTIEMGSFGTVSSGRMGASLAESAMQSHKIINVEDAGEDARYCSVLDGQVAPCVPMALVPIRGRGSAVIGVLISVRGRNGTPFSREDLVAAEMAVSHGALSLYWCQGLGSLHHVLTRNVNRLQELERSLLQLRR